MQFLFNPYNYDLSDPESIPNLFLQHLNLVLETMLISIIISIPLGLLVARYRRLYVPVITIADLLYTIPGVALIGILVTFTHYTPATVLIPLVIYTQLVLIRNTVVGVNGIDPLLIEVGHAMGMNSRQLLLRVTFPLAMPVIIAGIRIATVTTIGIASLASLASQGGLGDLIFNNITIASPASQSAVLAGAILMALFAIVADLILLAVQTAFNRGRSALSVT
jgi:osmoprotectant transport system permease protein